MDGRCIAIGDKRVYTSTSKVTFMNCELYHCIALVALKIT